MQNMDYHKRLKFLKTTSLDISDDLSNFDFSPVNFFSDFKKVRCLNAIHVFF